MRIQREDNVIKMSERIVCVNYFKDVNTHLHNKGIEYVSMDCYACNDCGVMMRISTPTLVFDEYGKLKMQVEVRSLRED
ncbi:hypothetical protein [Bacillus sp. ISL-46]|uniref:hypothetical protein n=1 Tax=Bacillus sp. ISL-46 TaxID=2819129 RepID=UPI001BE84EF4|nr:hypothetical protein [Bacillus sp. ISL-46]MBT2724431.1 hypothetical protein [Bacillus sp. ISL-46]